MILSAKRGLPTHTYTRMVRKSDGKDYWVRYYCTVVGSKVVRPVTLLDRFRMLTSIDKQ